jgi:hypothetical protein
MTGQVIVYLAVGILAAWCLFWAGYGLGHGRRQQITVAREPAPGRVLAELELTDLYDGTQLPVAYPVAAGGEDEVEAWVAAATSRAKTAA